MTSSFSETGLFKAFAEHCAVLSELTSAYTKKKDSGKPVPSKSNENGKQGSKEFVRASNRPEVDLQRWEKFA
ncbi:hypothetical protein Tco_1159862 [Tanacetum coccineum]